MKYNELNGAWQNQLQQYSLWEMKLNMSPRHIRDFLEERLSPPQKSWKHPETNEEHRYVEIFDIYNKSTPQKGSPNSSAITKKGVLVFGIGVTLDHGPDTYPKKTLNTPLCIRYKDGSLEYGFYDQNNDEAFNEWVSDKESFYEKFVKSLYEHLSHDPHNGFGEKREESASSLISNYSI